MFLKAFGWLFSIVLLLRGAISFASIFMPKYPWLHWLLLDWLQAIFLFLTGLIGLAATAQTRYTQLFLKCIGLIYGLIAILSFALNGQLIFFHISLANAFFYLIMAMLALYVGFTTKNSMLIKR